MEKRVEQQKLLFLSMCSSSDRNKIIGRNSMDIHDFERISYLLGRGFGNCRISSTDVRHVWKVQYLNNAPARLMILNTLVVAGLPEEAVAASEDLADSAVRIKELIEWVTKSWELSPVEIK